MFRKISIIGNVTKDAEVFSAQTKSAVNFTVAVNERWKDQAGEKKERTTFVKCVIWCKNPAIAPYIKKGLKVYIDGTPDVEAYINNEGKAIGNLKILVKDIFFLNRVDNKTDNTSDNSSALSTNSSYSDNLVPTPNDDLPF